MISLTRTIRALAWSLFYWPLLLTAQGDPQTPLHRDQYPDPEEILRCTRSGEEEPCYETQVSFLHHEAEEIWTWGPCGTYTAEIPIRRFFGTEQQIRKMVDMGIMEKNARLYIPCNDCDSSNYSDPSVAPERDQVFLNGHFLGFLEGLDETVTENTFDVPLEYLNFPTYPGLTARNTLTILVDTANPRRVWVLGQLWQMLVIQAPPPVLLVHGWTPDQESLAEFSRHLTETLGLPNTLAEVSHLGNPLENAQRLEGDLAGLTAQWGVNQFNIVAHSKGGLDTRVLIDRQGMNSSYVHRLIQVSTPNAGSPFADAVITPQGLRQGVYSWLGPRISYASQDSPGLQSLTTENCKAFNQTYRAPNCAIDTITGNVDWLNLSLEYQALALLVNVKEPNDGMVTVNSAHCLGTAMEQSPLSDASSRFDHSGIVRDGSPTVIQSCQGMLREIPQTNYAFPPYAGNRICSDTRASRSADIQNSETDGEYGFNAENETFLLPLEAGKTTQAPFRLLTKGDAVIGVLFCAPGTAGELLLADGETTLPMDFQDATPELLGGDAFLMLPLEDAPAGEYRILVDCTNAKEDRLGKVIIRETTPALRLEIQAKPRDSSKMDACVTARAIYDETQLPLTKQCMTLWTRRVEATDNQALCLEMQDDGMGDDEIAGDGIYTVRFHPGQEGLWDLGVEMTAEHDGVTLHRYASQTLALSDVQGTIATPLKESLEEDPLDDLLKNLVFTTQCTASVEGEYSLLGRLYASDGTVIAEADTRWSAVAGESQECVLEFQGSHILQSGKEGPWILGGLTLAKLGSEETPQPIMVCEPEYTQETQAGELADFQEFNFEIELSGTGTEKATTNDYHACQQVELRLDLHYEGTLPDGASFQLPIYDSEGLHLGILKGELEQMADGTKLLVTTMGDGCMEYATKNGPYFLRNCTMRFPYGEEKRVFFIKGEYQTKEYDCRIFKAPVPATNTIPKEGLEVEVGESPDESGRYRAKVRYTCPESAPEEEDPEDAEEEGGNESEESPIQGFLLYNNQNLISYFILEGATAVSLSTFTGPCKIVTDEAREQLLSTGNKDGVLDPGETLEFDVALIPTEEIPESLDLSKCISLMILSHSIPANYHAYNQILHPFDLNRDLTLSQEEIHYGKNAWSEGQVSPALLLEALELLDAEEYLYDAENGHFSPL